MRSAITAQPARQGVVGRKIRHGSEIRRCPDRHDVGRTRVAAHEAHLADRGIDHTTFAHWERLDAHEIALGGTTRARVKVAGREEMLLAGQ